MLLAEIGREKMVHQIQDIFEAYSLPNSVRAFLIGLCVCFLYGGTAEGTTILSQPRRTASIPIVFEQNQGQFDAATRYVARNAGGMAAFYPMAPEFSLGKASARARVKLLPSMPTAQTKLVAENATGGKVNYFLGQTATAQLQSISTYKKLRYENFMPGVDLAFYGSGDYLEHDFVVAPEIDPGIVRFRMSGADSVHLSTNGELLVNAAESRLLFRKPTGYQIIAGKRVAVVVAFHVSRDGEISFRVSRYDPTHSLTIDPVLLFSTYLDGTRQDTPSTVTTDSTGNIYVAGFTQSPDFPTAGAYQSKCGTCNANASGYISKLDPTGQTLLYSTYFVGNGDTDIFRIKIDSDDNLVGVGYTESTNFPKVGHYVPSYASGAFVFSLSPTGTTLNHAEIIGAGPNAYSYNYAKNNPYGLALDSRNNVYVAEVFSFYSNGNSIPFPITAGTYAAGQTLGEKPSIVLAKIGSDGSLIYGTAIPPVHPEAASQGFYLYLGGIGVDAQGDVFVSAATSEGMPTTSGSLSPAFPNTNPRNVDYSGLAGYVLALDPDAAKLLFATYLPGTDSASTLALAVDGTAYIAGTTSETTLPVSNNAFQSALKVGEDCTCNGGYVLNLSKDGSKVVHATYLSGTIDANNEVTNYGSTVTDSAGNVFVGGNVSSADSPQTNPVVSYLDYTDNLVASGTYVAGLSSDLSKVIFGSYFSGDGAGDLLSDIAVSKGRLVLSGTTFADTGFLTTKGVVQPSAPARLDSGIGYQHEFVASIDLTVPAPAVCLSTRSVSFGSVSAGTTASAVVTVTNCGNAPLSISSLASDSQLVSASPLNSSLAAGQSYPITVKFSPIDGTQTYGFITVSSNATVPNERLAFVGQGVVPQLTILYPAVTNPISLPEMTFGASPASSTGVYISNTGRGPLTISSASITGEFTLENDCGKSLMANDTCGIGIFLAPLNSGLKQGVLTINSNDPTRPALTLNVSGNVLPDPNSPTITFNIPNQTYGVSPLHLSASSVSSGAFTYSVVSGPASISGAILTITGVGMVQVLATQAAGDKYSAGSQVASFQVGPAALSLKANDSSRVYGAPNPPFTGSLSGIMNNDALLETFTTTAIPTSSVGTYGIVPSVSGSTVGNYVVTTSNGKLTIKQATAAVVIVPGSTSVQTGQIATLSISVTSSTIGIPTGAITLQDNGSTFTTLLLVNGTATYSSALPSGVTHHFAAIYSGDTNFAAATTATLVSVAVSGVDSALGSQTSTQQVAAGSSVTYALQLTPGTGSYPSQVTFSTQGLPSGFTATFSPSTVTVGATAQTIQMVLQAPATKALSEGSPLQSTRCNKGTTKRLPLTLAFVLLPLIGLGSVRRWRTRSGMPLCFIGGMALCVAAMSGCGTSPSPVAPQPQSQTYIVTVTATSGAVQHTTTVSLVW